MGRLVDCNDAFAETFGFFSRAEVLTLKAWDLYLDRQDRDADIQPDRVTENHVARELPFRHNTGRPIWLRFTRAVVSRTSGRPELLLVTAVDVTELRRLRAQFRELSKETRKRRVVGQDSPPTALIEELASHLQRISLAVRPEELEMLSKLSLQRFIQSVERMKVLMEELAMNQVEFGPQGKGE
jgi:PAS domain S-box-containing protein